MVGISGNEERRHGRILEEKDGRTKKRRQRRQMKTRGGEREKSGTGCKRVMFAVSMH